MEDAINRNTTLAMEVKFVLKDEYFFYPITKTISGNNFSPQRPRTMEVFDLLGHIKTITEATRYYKYFLIFILIGLMYSFYDRAVSNQDSFTYYSKRPPIVITITALLLVTVFFIGYNQIMSELAALGAEKLDLIIELVF